MPCGLSVGYCAFDCALDALMSNETDWRILMFPRIKWGAGEICEAKWGIEGVRIGNTTIQIQARRGQGLERVFRFFKAASV